MSRSKAANEGWEKLNKVTHHYKCDTCLAVYFSYYPVDDTCSICGSGRIHMVDEPVTHKI